MFLKKSDLSVGLNRIASKDRIAKKKLLETIFLEPQTIIVQGRSYIGIFSHPRYGSWVTQISL